MIVQHVDENAAKHCVALHYAWRTESGDKDSRIQTSTHRVANSRVPRGFNFDPAEIVVEGVVRHEIVGPIEYRDSALLVRDNAVVVDDVVLHEIVVGEVRDVDPYPYIAGNVIRHNVSAARGSNSDAV